MNIFYRRNLTLLCAIFAVASVCGCFLAFNDKVGFIALALFLFLGFILLTVFLKKYRARFFTVVLCVLFAAVALISQLIRMDYQNNKLSDFYDTSVSVTATVLSVEYSSDYASSYTVKLESVNDIAVSSKAVLEFEYNAELEVGERLSGFFTPSNIEKYYENSSYMKAKSITTYLHSPHDFTSEQGETPTFMCFAELNKSLSDIILDAIDGEEGNLVSALMLGNKDLLDGSTKLNFRRAGLSHVLALSGMHLSVLIFFFDYILRKIYFPKGIRCGIVITVALFYLALTGFTVSAVRAFVMSAMVYLAFLLQSDNDLLTSLMFSLFIILIVSPYSVYDIGLWLSFLSVLGIFTAMYFIDRFTDFVYSEGKAKKNSLDKYARKLKKRKSRGLGAKFIVYLFSSVIITLFANIFICLPAWMFFEEISLISLPANLIASPLVTVIMYLFPVFLVCSPVPYISSMLADVISAVSSLLLKLVGYITSFEHVTFSTNYFFLKPIVIFVAVSLALFLIIKLRHKWVIIIPQILGVAMFLCMLTVDNLYYCKAVTVDYIGGNESEMLLVRDADEYSIVDISTGGYAYAQSAYYYSLENCATEISSYVITHYHNRNINAMRRLFDSAQVMRLYLPYPQDLNEYYIMSSIITVAVNSEVDVMLYDSLSDTKISENVSLNLSQRGYLKRSTHPTFYVELEAYNKSVIYLGESLSDHVELTEQSVNLLTGSEYIILGQHGPKTKQDFKLQNISQKAKIIVSNQEIMYHFQNQGENIFQSRNYARIILTSY